MATAFIGLVAVLGSLVLGPSEDRVSDGDKAAWQAAFAAAAPFVLDVVPFEEREEAVAAMGLDTSEQSRLLDSVGQGETRLVWLTFQDVVAEDGDRVRVESDGYRIEVPIRHEATRIVIPEPSSGIVNVVGTADGGGGITIAITSGGVPVNLPFMTVGEAVGVPVVTRR